MTYSTILSPNNTADTPQDLTRSIHNPESPANGPHTRPCVALEDRAPDVLASPTQESLGHRSMHNLGDCFNASNSLAGEDYFSLPHGQLYCGLVGTWRLWKPIGCIDIDSLYVDSLDAFLTDAAISVLSSHGEAYLNLKTQTFHDALDSIVYPVSLGSPLAARPSSLAIIRPPQQETILFNALDISLGKTSASPPSSSSETTEDILPQNSQRASSSALLSRTKLWTIR
ncbi:hypothetical protein BKA70DRAFT_1435112 [Coprinopsis sp. MPI-PUGE-AT-0042]|nr:hypothetical protein BKA70DRAFT_1435112 [Coprinopsis sp. MPI-PUGE-AT-0042]